MVHCIGWLCSHEHKTSYMYVRFSDLYFHQLFDCKQSQGPYTYHVPGRTMYIATEMSEAQDVIKQEYDIFLHWQPLSSFLFLAVLQLRLECRDFVLESALSLGFDHYCIRRYHRCPNCDTVDFRTWRESLALARAISVPARGKHSVATVPARSFMSRARSRFTRLVSADYFFCLATTHAKYVCRRHDIHM